MDFDKKQNTKTNYVYVVYNLQNIGIGTKRVNYIKLVGFSNLYLCYSDATY